MPESPRTSPRATTLARKGAGSLDRESDPRSAHLPAAFIFLGGARDLSATTVHLHCGVRLSEADPSLAVILTGGSWHWCEAL